MYRRNSVGPRMQPSGTPALTGYSCEDFPSRTTQNHHKSLDSQFFRTTTGIQSGPDASDESWFVLTFLIILVVAETLCSFTLVLEGKTSKKISELSRLEFLEKFLANNFV